MASLFQRREDFESNEFQLAAKRQLDFIWSLANASGLEVAYAELNDWCDQFQDDYGNEHLAYFVPDTGRVYKRTIGSLSGNELFGVEGLPIPYLMNQALVSKFFGTETLFEGIALRPGEQTTEFIISQRHIKAADRNKPNPTESEIVDFFEKREFFPVSSIEHGSQTPRFERRTQGLELAIVDSHIRNFIQTEEGIKPFDVHFEILNEESMMPLEALLE